VYLADRARDTVKVLYRKKPDFIPLYFIYLQQPSWLSDMDDHSDMHNIDELNHRLIQVWYNLDMGHYRHGYWPMV